MDEQPILVEQQPGYRVITLNRPQRLNAFTEAMHQALRAALADAEADETCRALLITGAGRGFCAGQDLNDRLSKAGETPVLGGALEAYYNPLVRKLRGLPFPVVAAVNGVAAGAGCNIALACDIVLAARAATFVQSFAKIGLVPDSGGTWILPRLIGPARARALALTAEPVPAEKAESWGMIWKALRGRRALVGSAQALPALRFGTDARAGADQTRARPGLGERPRRPARPRTRIPARSEPDARLCGGRARVPGKARAGVSAAASRADESTPLLAARCFLGRCTARFRR